MSWWLRGLFPMQELQMQELSQYPPSTIASRGLVESSRIALAFLLHTEVWVLPKGSCYNPPVGFPGAARLSLGRADGGGKGAVVAPAVESGAVLDSASPGDCQGSCQLQGMLTSDTAQHQRFSSTFLLHLPALWKQAGSWRTP